MQKVETGAEAGAKAGVEGQIAAAICRELGVSRPHVESVVRLLDEGNTIPFLARYRKEQTGGLDEEVLRAIRQRLEYLRSLADRRAEVIRLIDEQGALTPEIAQALEAATTLQRVDDIYRPFRPKRRTRAGIARERGLEPLAAWLMSRPATGDPLQRAGEFVDADRGVDTADQALAGARDIIAEIVADDPEVRSWVRQWTTRNGTIFAEAVDSAARTPYEQYYAYSEPVARIRPHRVLAINRGEREKALRVKIEVPAEQVLEYLRRWLAREGGATGSDGAADACRATSPADPELASSAADAYTRLLAPAVERDVRHALTEQADAQAIRVFGANLKSLLLTPPTRGKVVMGVDPAYRTGCKIAVVDATGKLLEVAVVYPTPPQRRVEEAERVLLAMIERHGVDLIAIGNGTASREAEAFIAGLIQRSARSQSLAYAIVSEAGASVYSASATAREEFPGLDVSERSAISIARRLQDPLAELVKIEPKAIGVGQYQHDVAEGELVSTLSGVVESAVNRVGVDLNTASAALLSYVAGLSKAVSSNIVKKREADGPFSDRSALMSVPRLGPRTFEQCAGFLRVPDGANPLDNTPIHPESYLITERLLTELGFSVDDVGRGAGSRRQHELREALDSLKIDGGNESQVLSGWAARLGVGVPTLQDIVEALERPGRDPRDEMPQPVLRTDVLTMDDLHPGMTLEGTVRNVVDFGAFVDIGVQQDGLVHISELSDTFVRHPLDAVSVGDIVCVRVLSVDKERGRVALSMKTARDTGELTCYRM
ncbi:MAG TPA: Tex family protein [Bacillota bacterium]|jgi:uncharacterized protein|nr:Tex family protein [Bacillota bacterium]HOI37024.1 Tex family protein [Bacillota bacterium]HPU75228.1 Tex family protein [Bacillota bacterium]